MADQVIDLSAGAIEYSYPRTITSPTDITTDTIDVSLGSYDAPGTWLTPDIRTSTTSGLFAVTVQLLIGASLTPASGDYWLWVRLHDSPEVLPVRTPGRVRIA